MTRRETRFTNLLRSRGIGTIISAISICMIWRCLPAEPITGSLGLSSELSGLVYIALLFAIGTAMIIVNRQFNLLRTLSVFFAAYFIFITAATTGITAAGLVSPALAVVMIAGMWILFSIYNRRRSDRRIFLIFAMLSAGAIYDWRFLFYVPTFFAGIAQMRILRFKKVIAAFIGLVTPPWIALGLGLMQLPALPHIYFTPPSMLLSSPDRWPFLCTVLLTLFTGFIFGSANLIRIIGFNARARAYNGFLSLLGITTGLLALINFTALPVYVTLLNACVAFQVGHFFRATASRRGYIVILLLLAAYTALYIWGLSAS